MSELLAEGLFLMLFGMGTVITFLTILVLMTKVMSALLLRFGLADVELPGAGLQPIAPSNSNSQQDEEVVAVITAAIQQFRSRHK
ncbi:MAG: OadG family protein [Pseudomonadales bacterium]|nr:OadG family protein [Pseudomonadales bacterium]